MLAGWLRTLRAPNLQLAVELTDAGRAIAHPLLLAEQNRLRAEQRTAEVVVLPLIPLSVPPAEGTSAKDLPVELDVAQWLHACHDAGIEVRVQVNESVTL